VITPWLPSGMVHRAKFYCISSTSSHTLDYRENNFYGICYWEKDKLFTLKLKNTSSLHMYNAREKNPHT